MNYLDNKEILKTFYGQYGLLESFDRDNTYLEKAFDEICKIWLDNLNQIKSVKYLMIAEAPLWGESRKYIYNPKTSNSQFFYRSDLSDILRIHIADKKRFIGMKSRMTGDCHVRFRGNVGVKSLCVTRLAARRLQCIF